MAKDKIDKGKQRSQELERKKSALRWKKRMRRSAYYLLVFSFSILLLSFFFESDLFENWLKNIFEKNLREFCGRNVTVGKVEFKFPSITLTLNELKIEGLPTEERPFFEALKIKTKLGVLGFLNREINLKYIEFTNPKLSLKMDRNGRLNIPQFKTDPDDEGTPFFEIVADKLNMQGGLLYYKNQVVKTSGKINDFRSVLRYDPKNDSYAGEIHFDKANISVARFSNLELSLNSKFVLLPDRLIFPDVHLKFSGVDVRSSGVLYDFDDLKYNIDFKGTYNLALLSDLFDMPVELNGLINAQGIFKSSVDGFVADGSLRAPATRIDRFDAGNLYSHFIFTSRGITFTDISADIFDGKIRGSFGIENSSGFRNFILKLKGENLDSKTIGHSLGIEGLRLRSRDNFTCDVSWNDVDLKSLSGRFDLYLAKDLNIEKKYLQFITSLQNDCGLRPFSGDPALEVEIPVSGDIHVLAKNGRWETQTSTVNLPLTRLVFFGKGDLLDKVEQEVKIESHEIKEFDLFILRLARILRGWDPERGPLPRIELPPPFVGLKGAAQFRGRFVYEKEKPFIIYGNGFGKRLWVHNTFWDEGGGFVDFRNNHLVFTKGWSKKNDGSSKFSGEIHLFEPAPKGTSFLKITATFSSLPFEDVEDLFLFPRDLTGPVSGDFLLEIDAEGKINGLVDGKMNNGVFFKDGFDQGKVNLKFDNKWLHFKEIFLQKGEQTVDASLDLDLKEAAYKLKGRIEALKLEELKSLYLDRSPIAGKLYAEIDSEGYANAPAVDMVGTIKDMTFLKKPLGDLEFNIFNEKNAIKLEAIFPEDSTFINMSMNMNKDYSFTANGTVSDVNLYKLLPYTGGIIDRVLGGNFSGKANIKGSVLHIGDVSVQGDLDSFNLFVNKYSAEIKTPLKFNIHDFIMNVEPVTITDGSSLLNLSGKVGLSRRFPSDLKVDLDVQLSELVPMFINLNLKGNAKGTGYLRGFILEPYWGGKAEIKDGFLQYLNMPAPLEEMEGTVKFTQNTVTFENMKGKMGGGDTAGDGQLTFKNSRPDRLLFRFSGEKIRLEYPVGAEMVLNGALNLSGEWENKELSGDLNVEKLRYTRRFDPEDLVTGFARKSVASVGSDKVSFFKTMRVNLDVKGSDNILIDNNFAQVALRADFKLAGNILKPNILGRVETQDGQVYYRDRTFEILSASFENFDPSRLNPVIDLRSKTKVKNYTIYLSIHGTKDKMYPSLSSEPSLPTVDIINLLTLGKERTSYYERSEESLLGVGISSLLLGPVFGGIEEGAEQLFGFDRFRIDPFLVGNKSNPTARLTVGKRITKDLTLIYSTNITQSREDVLILEYRLSNNIILVASRDEYGVYGVDVQFESKF
jgi:hypothetical protein